MTQCAKPHLVLNAGLGARSRRPGVPHPWPIQQVSFRGLQEGTGTAWDTNDLKFLPRSTDNLSVRKSQSKSIRRGQTQTHTKEKERGKQLSCQGLAGVGEEWGAWFSSFILLVTAMVPTPTDCTHTPSRNQGHGHAKSSWKNHTHVLFLPSPSDQALEKTTDLKIPQALFHSPPWLPIAQERIRTYAGIPTPRWPYLAFHILTPPLRHSGILLQPHSRHRHPW